ncbi:MAG: hypothetical protein NT169_19910 [Chloroflexi bacterium]|nr:hypothetical protein [Chloroflexota bacterium]
MTEVDWLRAEIVWLRERLAEKDIETGLCLCQDGPATLISVTREGFTEGILDGAVIISGMRAMGNKIEIHSAPGRDGYAVRSLRQLVESSADSYLFLRDGDDISNMTEDVSDTPWRVDVGDAIVRHFSPVLWLYMPQGLWHLGIGATYHDL